MEQLLQSADARLRRIIDIKLKSGDISGLWEATRQEILDISGNEDFLYLVNYLCRLVVFGDTRNVALNETMEFAYKANLTRKVSDDILYDILSLTLVAFYKGNLSECLGYDWPNSDLLNRIFDAIEEIVGEGNAGALGMTNLNVHR
ncbi:hypothetical protein [Methylobacterium brachiatum]|uniref:hypothetical protein n=1 Tax=Methylobacterium brachiatum TaxID=269660 RepID=UPI00244D292D|nr:hypothetical protein [Methylobacterium brachiatum]MDH2313900.1 hypothetical protein [Methylobacterium brachiatum]